MKFIPKKAENAILDTLFIIVGTAIHAVAINSFIVPNNIVPGGATGIATLINHFTQFPIGVSVILINIPLFILGFLSFGAKNMVRTVVATGALSAALDILAFLPSYTEDKFLASVIGGALCGFGLGLIYLRGMQTGGSDLAAALLEKKFPFISYGKMIIIIDIVIVGSGALAYKDITSVLYAAIMIFVSGVVVDKLMMGADQAKAVYIISSHSREIYDEILVRLNRGVTLIDCRGAYTGMTHDMIFTVVRKVELHRVKDLVKEIDKKAFIIIGDVSEVLGEGFKAYIEPEKLNKDKSDKDKSD